MTNGISFNRMIKKAAKKVVEDDISFLNETEEEIDLEFSREFTKEINGLFAEQAATPKPKRLRIVPRLSVAALAAMLAFTFIFSNIYPAIVEFSNSKSTKFFHSSSSSGIVHFLKPAIKTFKCKNPEYIPSGLKRIKKTFDKYKYNRRYELKYRELSGEKYFTYIQVFKGFKSPDIVGYVRKRNIFIGKYEAGVAVKTENGTDTFCIYWDDSTYHYEIYSNLTLDEVTKIAESIE